MAVAGTLVVGLGAVGATHLTGSAGGPGGFGKPDLGTVEYASFKQAVAPDADFEFPIAYDLTLADVDSAVQVYLDPLLRVRAPGVYVAVRDGVIRVAPGVAPIGGVNPDGEAVDLSRPKIWGFADTYFIAELRDAATGAPLPEPKVTAFSVAGLPATTPVDVTVDPSGVGHLSWQPVEGATRYYVISLESFEDASIAFPDIIGETTATSWTTIEQDESVREGLADTDTYGLGVGLQNYAFHNFRYSNDDLQSGDVLAEENTVTNLAYGVLPVREDGIGPLSLVDDPTLASELPYSIAHFAAREIKANGGNVDTAEEMPASMPVTMCDGATVLRPLLYGVDTIASSRSLLGDDETGEQWWDETFTVPYTIEGTLFRGAYTIMADSLAQAQELVRGRNAAILAQRVKGGVNDSFTYTTEIPSLDNAQVSHSAPDVPYPVSGTNPLTKYLAANLIAGSEYIDLSAYLPKGSKTTETGVDLWDALAEATEQNPFTLGHASVHYVGTEQVLVVTYEDFDGLDARRTEQQTLAAEVERVTAQIITAGMSTQDKVQAINAYLVSSAEYDYTALAAKDEGAADQYPHAWTAYGILVDKKGVCASYAQAFKALADAAGIESMYVTGVVNQTGGRHAWNKVNLDGTWRMLDATWNDSPEGDKYLFLTDAQSAETRVEDSAWVLDSRVGDYAAN